MFSLVQPGKFNYDVEIADCQRLHNIETKLTVAIAVLEQSLAVGRSIEAHFKRLERTNLTKIDLDASLRLRDEVNEQMVQLELYKVSCELLLGQVHRTCALVCSLPYGNIALH
jgi:hypothetical protein